MSYGLFYLALLTVVGAAGFAAAFLLLWLVYVSDGGRLGPLEWARRMLR